MGRAHRNRPKRLAEKLLTIRTRLDLTQPELIKRLKAKGERLHPASISLYESGQREPPLIVLLRYARLAGVPMDVLVDDKLDLPK
jgi:transcriptional regulator with XRE-family HTH domain